MTLSTSRVVSSCSNSGFSAPGVPMRASMAVPPLAGLGTVAIGWQAPTASTARATAARRAAALLWLAEVLPDPDVGNRADQEGGDDHPGGPVDLPFQTQPHAVAPTMPLTTAADVPTQPLRLGSLHQDARHQQDLQHHLDDDERVFDPSHMGTREFYLYRSEMAVQFSVLNQAAT